MTRRILIAAELIIAAAFATISCKGPQQEEPQEDPVVAPTATVELNALDRTSVTFTISSDSPGDYVWAIVPETEKIASAEELFSNGNSGMFTSAQKIEVTYNELEGGNEYSLYYAVRKINPFVYSELYVEPVSTDFPYEEMGVNPDYKWRVGRNLVPIWHYGEGEDRQLLWGLTALITLWLKQKLEEYNESVK